MPTKPAEPTPQKPDSKLAPDAIRASKAGGKPLSEHIRKQEEKRKAGGKKPGGKTAPAPNPAEIVDLLAKKEEKDRSRKSGAGTAAPAEEEAGATLGGREQRQLKRKRSATVKRRHGEEGNKPDNLHHDWVSVEASERTSPSAAFAAPSACATRFRVWRACTT